MKLLFLSLISTILFSLPAMALNYPQDCVDALAKVKEPSNIKVLGVDPSKFQPDFLVPGANRLIGYDSKMVELATYVGPGNLSAEIYTFGSSRGQVSFYVEGTENVLGYKGQYTKDGVTTQYDEVICAGFENPAFMDELMAGINVKSFTAKNDYVGVWGTNYRVEDVEPAVQETLNAWLEAKGLQKVGQDYIYEIQDIKYIPSYVGKVGYQVQVATSWQMLQNRDGYPYTSGDGYDLVIDIFGKLQLEVMTENMEITFAQ